MINFIKKRKLNIICSAAAVALVLLVWVIAYYSVRNDYLVPSFTATAVSFFECVKSGGFWLSVLNTLLRTFIAFIISFAVAACLAVFSIVSKAFRAFIKPFTICLRTLPTLAVILILLIWTNPLVAPVIVTVLVLFPMIYSQIIAAADSIDGGLIEMASVYGVSVRDRIFKIYLPVTAPNILSQAGANISFGLKIMISAEVLANTYNSLGGMMQTARLYAEMPRLAALTVIAVIVGLAVDIAFSQLERITFKWSKREGQRD